MRKLFYTRLALSNIRRNRKFYLPYILTCICTVAMFYIICALNAGNTLNGMKGEMILRSYMAMGGVVIAIFSLIFLFYTNSFLTRRRRREFGLYNILGMERRHIARVMLIETVFIAITSLILGLAVGLGLSKVVALATMKLVQAGATYGFEFVPGAAQTTIIVFAVIFALSYLAELLRMRRQNAIDLLRSAQQGEREPKTKWLITLLGLGCMGGGYYIAVSTEDPVKAVMLFLVAVILVILGTYMLFTSGSIALLKMLRARKNYFYKPNHFISVSGMIYRMKQNAAGLASICILSTMVLVMASATTALTIGTEDTIRKMYPYELSFRVPGEDETDQAGREAIETALAKYDTAPKDYLSYRTTTFVAEIAGDTVNLEPHENYQNLATLVFVPYEDYVQICPDSGAVQPGDGEALVCGDYKPDALNIGSLSYEVTGRPEGFTPAYSGGSYIYPVYVVILKDMEAIRAVAKVETDIYGEGTFTLCRCYGFNIPLEGKALEEATAEVLSVMLSNTGEGRPVIIEGPRHEGRAEQYALSGGLMFLGIFLGILFVMATVLMMYYKQISEGYEDRGRFAIMRKVGLDDAEIRKSIHSQVITVFFLPLITACIHTSMAFFIVRRVLMVLGLTNVKLLLLCTGGTMAVFAAFYIVTYLVTASVYYRIVARETA